MNHNMSQINQILEKLSRIDYIKPGEIPNIELYMDQVTTFMDSHLAHSKRYEDDKILTLSTCPSRGTATRWIVQAVLAETYSTETAASE